MGLRVKMSKGEARFRKGDQDETCIDFVMIAMSVRYS